MFNNNIPRVQPKINVNNELVDEFEVPDVLDNTKWQDKKKRSLLVAESFRRLNNFSKFSKISECGSYLEFKKFVNHSPMHLHKANFCKVRLCPMCAWRRSLKIFGQVSSAMDILLEEKNYRFLFLTLTCRNVKSEDLSSTIDELFEAYKLLVKKAKFKKAIKGWFRALEVTYNKNRDTYHPHLHIILVVNDSYFNDTKIYISQSEWVDLWARSLKVDYTPIVDIRAFNTDTKKKTSKSVAEACKYTVKDDDIIIKNKNGKVNQVLTDKAVKTLDLALKSRRLTASGGVFKEALKKAKELEDDAINEDLEYVLVRFRWNVGIGDYCIEEVRKDE